jgi:hypothetical protein
MRVLAGDIGATNARLAVVEAGDEGMRVLEESHFQSAAHAGLEPIVREFVSALPETPEADMESGQGPLDFVHEHEDDVERVALVGDDKRMKWLARLGDARLSPKLKRFDPDDEDGARSWITE